MSSRSFRSEQVRGLKVTTSIRAGGLTHQHNRRVLKVRSGVKSGGVMVNHNSIRRALDTVVERFAGVIGRGLRRGV